MGAVDGGVLLALMLVGDLVEVGAGLLDAPTHIQCPSFTLPPFPPIPLFQCPNAARSTVYFLRMSSTSSPFPFLCHSVHSGTHPDWVGEGAMVPLV